MIRPEEKITMSYRILFLRFAQSIPSVLTLNDSQQDDNHEEEESDVEHYAVDFVIIAVRFADLVADTSTSSHAFVQMENEALRVKEMKI